MGKTYGYVRVSSRDQNIQRQVDAITPWVVAESDIFTDKQSGKDFNRPQYQALKALLRPGDVIVIQSLDRLGRNYNQIKEEWRDLGARGVGIRVLDFPLLTTVTDNDAQRDLISAFISNIVLEVLSFVAENERNNIHSRQAQGIAAAKQRGVKFGRETVCPEAFFKAYRAWKGGGTSAKDALATCGMKKSTFYKRANELGQLLRDLEAGTATDETLSKYCEGMVACAMDILERGY